MTPHEALDEAGARRDWRVFTVLVFCFSFGFAVYNGIFHNFFREVMHGGPEQLGILESLRETPGLLTALLAGTLVALAEARLAGVALGLCAVGMAATGLAPSYWALVGLSVLWSTGFHLWSSVQAAITLSLARHQEGGRHLGRMAGVGALAVLTALLFTRAVKPFASYEALFALSGAMIMVASWLAFRLSDRASGVERRPIVFRRRYGLYYGLTFLEGCRRQVFGTFASFVLIAVYGADVTTMLNLALLNAAVSAVCVPMIGRMVDRLGERRMLTVYYVAIVGVFWGYATTRDVSMLYALFALDNLLFGFGVAITTYLNRIADKAELTPSLAMGTTMNHVAAVLVPVTGGMLWSLTGDYRIPFAIGIGVALVSLAATQFIPRAAPPATASPESASR
ncbi:MAG TPA: MFS transporter [Chthonomonadales bacterium]|nr:MFS transporter [Chthonomonadales bacterium]